MMELCGCNSIVAEEAQKFAHGVYKASPHQMLAYNLFPSFNWGGVSDVPRLT